MLDGKMEDDASLKQCLVILELADRLAANDPELAELYRERPSAEGGAAR
jgi:malyl-CoA/(S)-citramalyl-CoA lyase